MVKICVVSELLLSMFEVCGGMVVMVWDVVDMVIEEVVEINMVFLFV